MTIDEKNSEQNNVLPKAVTEYQLGDKKVFIVGTAHVSLDSVNDVEETIKIVNPDTICVELCESRYKSIIEKERWKKMNIFKVVKEKKSLFLLTQLIMGSFYRKIGEQLDVPPGAEMIKGIELADSLKKELVLADRNIEITLKRVWGGLGFFGKIKMVYQLISSLFIAEEIDSESVEKLKEKDQMEEMMQEFSKGLPHVKERLIDERDIYLAEKIRTAPGKTVVSVVGAGHVKGMLQHLDKENNLDPIMQIPKPSLLPKIIGWSIPAFIIGLISYGFFKNGAEQSMDSIYIWFLVNGIFSALGAALALGHPLTILTSFVAAPITSLNPMLAAGWFSGLVQAVIKKPTVEDMENLKEAFDSVKGFWLNPVSRVLLVVLLANVGSTVGTIVAGSWIAKVIL